MEDLTTQLQEKLRDSEGENAALRREKEDLRVKVKLLVEAHRRCDVALVMDYKEARVEEDAKVREVQCCEGLVLHQDPGKVLLLSKQDEVPSLHA